MASEGNSLNAVPSSGGSKISRWWGGGGTEPLGGGTPTSDAGAFSKNICKNKRIGSRWGAPTVPPLGSANAKSIDLNNDLISVSSSVKYLGANLDANLNFKKHTGYICGKAMANFYKI